VTVAGTARAAPGGLRVCVFNRSYPPEPGATGQLLADLAEDLVREHGHRVTVVAGPPLGLLPGDAPAAGRGRGLFRREWRSGVEVLRVRAPALERRRFAGRAVTYLAYFLGALLAALGRRRADVVVALTDPPIVGLAGLAAAWRSRAGFVFVCQDVFPEVAALLDDFRSPAVNRLLDRITRLLLRRADRVVAVGEAMRDRLVAVKGADAERVSVIHNWADCARIAPGDKTNPWARAQGLDRAFVVMHAGNVGLAQDLEVLLEAAAGLADCPDLVVVVMGDGPRRRALEAEARACGLANVRFLPFQPRSGLRDAFAAADVFVVSLRAGLAGAVVPSKLYGILAAGRPYVAAVEEASEVAVLTRKRDTGLLAAPGDPRDLADRIRALHRDRALGARLGANGRQAALDFDRPVQVRAYDALLRGVARELRPRPSLGKRPLDVTLAALGLVVSAPLWALVAAGIKLDDGGPVLFAQERVGRQGRRFVSWKFRSMVADADRRFGPVAARPDDPRVTRAGRILRATPLDALPQLVNILRGDMSFVGPRPLLPEEIDGAGDRRALASVPGYAERHRVRPGLTGIAQVFAARDVPARHKFRLDRLYVRRQGLWLDVRLILLSVWISLRGRWEHRGGKL